ncbi:Glycine receptor subunit alpha-3 [Halotydeus destructor]|nr:Glycine receptor subunit alpha-3 [Halotydeus destructor]
MPNSISSLLVTLSLVCLKPSESLINRDLPLIHPLTIETSIFIDDVSELKASKLSSQEFDLKYLLRQTWKTNLITCKELYLRQLAQSTSGPGAMTVVPNPSKMAGRVYLVSGPDIKGFWVPSTYVPEARKIAMETSATPNRFLSMFVRDNECEFVYRVRLDATVSCKTDFKHYPNDMQLCRFRMRSNSYNLTSVRYVWNKDGVILEPNAGKLNQFEMRLNYTTMYSVHDSQDDSFSWLMINFMFIRQKSHFLIQVVAPSVLLVSVAYCSCWIKLDAGPGRYLLTILTFLALVTLYNGYKADLPKTSYIMAADIWMFSCLIFIFSTIIELTVIAFIDKKQKRKTESNTWPSPRQRRPSCNQYVRKADIALKRILGSGDGNNSPQNKPQTNERLISNGAGNDLIEINFGKLETGNDTLDSDSSLDFVSGTSSPTADRTVQIDTFFRIAYPVAFIIFNCIYWPLLESRKLPWP